MSDQESCKVESIRSSITSFLLSTSDFRLCLLKDAALRFGEPFVQLDRMANRATAALLRAGVRVGDRVTLLHPGDYRWVAFACAVWRVGATLVPLNPRVPSTEPRIEDLTPFFASEEESLLERVSLSTPAFFLKTSGSTGMPKELTLTLGNLIASAEPAIAHLDLRQGDRWLLALPLHHVGGIGVIIRCLLAGAQLVFDPNEATHISYVPTQLYRALHSPLPSSIRVVLMGGAALPYSLYNGATRLGWPLHVSYGLTEMSSLVLCTNRPLWRDSTCYLGEPLPNREMKLAADGEILVRGPCLCAPGDWFPTRDIGSWSAEGGFAIVGRKDWQFISGGENIQPEEIEQELTLFPEIEEAIVVPQLDIEFGHRPVLFAKTSLPLSEIQTRLKTRLPSYKIPIALHPLPNLPDGVMKRDRRSLILSLNTKT